MKQNNVFSCNFFVCLIKCISYTLRYEYIFRIKYFNQKQAMRFSCTSARFEDLGALYVN